MRNVPAFAFAAASLFACHDARAADPPRAITPSVDIEIEDRSADTPPHTARLTMILVDGRAEIRAKDGDSLYELRARETGNADPRLELVVKRDERGSAGALDVTAVIPEKPAGRVLVARLERPGGHSTAVVAQVH
ncbi:MAG TPA: hypothetical protein VIF62_22195 [Labilithrix sp.]|jgi:hypothetical protein